MAKKKVTRRRSSNKKFKLQQGVIYVLTAISLFSLGCLLMLSFTKNGELLILLNERLVLYFGALAFLVPINLILLSILFTRMKSLTRPKLFLGFSFITVSLLTLTKSGIVGDRIFTSGSSLIFPEAMYALSLVALVLGLIVFFDTSFPQLFSMLGTVFSIIGGTFRSNGPKVAQPTINDKKGLFASDSKATVAIKDSSKNPPPSDEPIHIPKINNSRDALKPVAANGNANMKDDLILNKPLEMGVWEYPPLSLLTDAVDKKADRGDVKKIASVIERTLQSFGIQARVAEINVGPSVTQYALEIALGTKLSKITTLANDLALATEAPTGQIRIEAPIPGRNLVGIEIPNRSLELVSLKTMLSSQVMQKSKSKLAVPLGLNVSGDPIIADISKMPHVLIAGTTGSGKSVLVNSFISSLLFRASPSEVRFIMIDPKRVELTGYNDIPHLLAPVVVEAEHSVSALKWAVKEMERRYIQFAERGVKNIDSYNELAGFQAFPYIVIVIDELADLMALAPVEVEDSIARIAQMARATGIHLALATQRPSVDVLTGLIKANVPCRIAFSVSSGIDSKVIIDGPGAEKLLGRGDMLYVPPDQAKPTRIQGAFVSDQDVKRLVNFIKARGIPVEYTQEVIQQEVNIKRAGGSAGAAGGGGGGDDRDQLFEEAVRIVCQYDRASSSLLQRRLKIGFNRAARLLEELEVAGVVGPGEGPKPREVLIKSPEQYFNQPAE